jgi:hypothetical protein
MASRLTLPGEVKKNFYHEESGARLVDAMGAGLQYRKRVKPSPS